METTGMLKVLFRLLFAEGLKNHSVVSTIKLTVWIDLQGRLIVKTVIIYTMQVNTSEENAPFQALLFFSFFCLLLGQR